MDIIGKDEELFKQFKQKASTIIIITYFQLLGRYV